MENEEVKVSTKRGPGLLIAAICVGVVVVLGAVGIVLASQGVFTSKETKIRTAIEDSFELDELFKVFQKADVVKDGKCTLAIDGDISGNTLKGSIAVDMKENKEQCKLSANVSGVSVDMDQYFDKEKLVLSVPSLYAKSLTYNYLQQNTGAITQYTSAETLDSINSSLKLFSDSLNEAETTKTKFADFFAKKFDALEFTSVDDKDFTIDGEQKSCSGYTCKMDKAFIIGCLTDLKPLILEEVNKYQVILTKAGVTADTISSTYDEAIASYNELSEDNFNTNLTFYLKGGKLANVTTVAGDDEFVINFKGGDTRSQNMEILYNKSGTCVNKVEKTGVIDNDVETVNLTFTSSANSNSTSFGWKYNMDNGSLDVTAAGQSLSQFADVSLKNESGALIFTMNSLNVPGYTGTGTIKLSGEADVTEPTGESVDIGMADMTQLQEIIQGVQSSPLAAFFGSGSSQITN